MTPGQIFKHWKLGECLVDEVANDGDRIRVITANVIGSTNVFWLVRPPQHDARYWEVEAR